MSEFILYHVSDLHFGDSIDQRSRRSATPGLAAHDPAACEDLENEIKAISRRHRRASRVLLATGDLTTIGRPAEFVTALTFLGGRLRRYWRRGFGLGPWLDGMYAVPGNHDHLKNKYRRGVARWPNLQLHGSYFAGSAQRRWWHSARSRGGVQLQLMGIDSSGVARPYLWTQGFVDPAWLGALAAEVHTADQRQTRTSLDPGAPRPPFALSRRVERPGSGSSRRHRRLL